MSVAKITQAGNDVYLSAKDPHIKNVRTGQKTKLRKEGKVYVIDLWVKVGKTQQKNKDDMDVDHLICQPCDSGFTRQG